MSNRVKARPASRARRPVTPGRRTRSWLWPAVGGAALVVAIIIVAVVLSGGDDEPPETVRVNGPALTGLDPAEADAAIGVKAPVFQAASLDGPFATVGSGGGPNDPARVFLFVSHWCDGCEGAVADAIDLVAADAIPSGTVLEIVLTDEDDSRQNHPPATWLRESGWQGRAYPDSLRNTLAKAYGVSQLPAWVVLDNNNIVLARAAGDADLARLVEIAATG